MSVIEAQPRTSTIKDRGRNHSLTDLFQMPQHIATVSVEELGYGIGKPLDMLNVASSDREAERIRRKATPAEGILSTEKPATLDEAIVNTFSFAQVYGRKGGSLENQVACYSNGHSWDRQTDYRPVAKEIILNTIEICDDNVQLVQYGKHKLVAFVRGKQDPIKVMQRFNDAPEAPYRKYLPHLADAQNEIQQKRRDDPNIQNWIDVFEGRRDGIKRAYEDDGKWSFWWAYEQAGNQLRAVAVDNSQKMTMTQLAYGNPELKGENPDWTTSFMLLDIQKFLAGFDDGDRLVIEIDNGADVSCCRDSFNAQQKWDRDIHSAGIAVKIGRALLNLPNGERYEICKSCGKFACLCSVSFEELSTGE